MAGKKPIWIDGKPHRMRRGKLVEIPAEWLGKVPSQQTINKRPSKQLHKHRKRIKYGDFNQRGRRRRERENAQVDAADAGPMKASVLDNP